MEKSTIENQKALQKELEELKKEQKNYWTKKSNYKDERQPQTGNYVKVFNKETKKWEKVRLLDYTNSFIETNKTIDEIILNQNKKAQSQADNLVAEITKLQNVTNITDEEPDEKKQIRKLYNYIEELKKEQKDKGENK